MAKLDKIYPFITAVITTLTVSGCSLNDTSISLNDRVVYQPDGIAKIDHVADRKLANCINSTLEKNNMSSLADLEHLNCSHQQIVSLTGIDQLTKLKTVNLSNNFIDDVSPLSTNKKLEEIYLRDNRLRRIDEVFDLPKLFAVKLAGNHNLACSSLPTNNSYLQIERPKHCE